MASVGESTEENGNKGKAMYINPKSREEYDAIYMKVPEGSSKENSGNISGKDSGAVIVTDNSVGSDNGSIVKDGSNGRSTEISSIVPERFKGSTNGELIKYLEGQISGYKPLSDEDIKKIRRRQKAEGIVNGIADAVSSVANLIAVHNYAPNMNNGKSSMSAAAKARWDKEKAERDAADEKYFNMALRLAQLKGQDRDKDMQIWKMEQDLLRSDRAYKDGRKDRDDDVNFRNKNYDRQGEWHKDEVDRWERQFKQSIEQFKVSSELERRRLGIESQRLAVQMQQGQVTFNLGNGNGNISISTDKLNTANVSRIFSTLPESVRKNVHGDPIYKTSKDMMGNETKEVVGYKDPSTEAMLIAIGANVESSPATQSAIKQVAGKEVGATTVGW